MFKKEEEVMNESSEAVKKVSGAVTHGEY